MLHKTLIILILLFTSLYGHTAKGEKIYSIMCDKEQISALQQTDTPALKKQIKEQKLCGNLTMQQLDALVLFLTSKDKTTKAKPIVVPEKSRCPVCGMFIAKYPKWVSMIETKNGKKYYFDGVKDMMKFYFDPQRFHHDKEAISSILVTDYYTLEAIVAKKAFYVIGSDIYGPMGEELIPFQSKEEAKNFLLEHHGKKIVTFAMIKETFLY